MAVVLVGCPNAGVAVLVPNRLPPDVPPKPVGYHSLILDFNMGLLQAQFTLGYIISMIK